MKDEIKEIERILATSGKYITYAERCYVLDYITNLKEENKRLKELDENYPIEEQLEEALKENKRLKRLAGKDYTELNVAEMNATIYKSRINKAIEYIEKCMDSEDIYEQFLSTGETKKVLNILEGEDKDVKD